MAQERQTDSRITSFVAVVAGYEREEDKSGEIRVRPVVDDPILTIGKQITPEDLIDIQMMEVTAICHGLSALQKTSTLEGIRPDLLQALGNKSLQEIIAFGQSVKDYLERELGRHRMQTETA